MKIVPFTLSVNHHVITVALLMVDAVDEKEKINPKGYLLDMLKAHLHNETVKITAVTNNGDGYSVHYTYRENGKLCRDYASLTRWSGLFLN